MRGFALACLCAASPAMADPFAVDLAAAFAAHAADAVVDEQGRRAVTLPGEVVVLQIGSGTSAQYTGWDNSGHGTVGCIAEFLYVSALVDRTCPEFFSSDEATQLATVIDRYAAFYAANGMPPRPADAVMAEVETRLAEMEAKARAQTPEGARCTFGEAEDFLLRGLSTPKVAAEIDDLLSVPRLPVNAPCASL